MDMNAAAYARGEYAPSSMSRPPQQPRKSPLLVVMIALVILVLVGVFVGMVTNNQDDKKSSRRRSVRRHGRPHKVLYADADASPYVRTRVPLPDPDGTTYAQSNPHKIIARDSAPTNYDPTPYRTPDAESDSHSDSDSDGPDDDDDHDTSSNEYGEEGEDVALRVATKPHRIPGMYADKINPDDPTVPGMQKQHEHYASMHGYDAKKLDPYVEQRVAVTGDEYLKNNGGQYPGNMWGLEPHASSFSIMNVPPEISGGQQSKPNLKPKTDKPSWKERGLTPKQAANRHSNMVHEEMEKSTEKMLDRLRSTVEDIPDDEKTTQQKMVRDIDFDTLRQRSTGSTAMRNRAYMHKHTQGGLGMNHDFKDMGHWEKHRKMDQLLRQFVYTALKGNHTNMVSLLHAMGRRWDSQINVEAAQKAISSIASTHDVVHGEWKPKPGFEDEDMNTAIGRILPHGRERPTPPHHAYYAQ